MNTNKLQKDFLSKMLSQKYIFYGYKDDKIGLADERAVYIMQKKDCMLNMENVPREPIKLDVFMGNERDAMLAVKIPELIQAKGKKLLIHLCAGDMHVYVDQDLVKYFAPDAQYFISGAKQPVYIKENDEIVGLVMPEMV